MASEDEFFGVVSFKSSLLSSRLTSPRRASSLQPSSLAMKRCVPVTRRRVSSALLHRILCTTSNISGSKISVGRTEFAFTDRKLAKLTDGTIYATAGVSGGSGAVSTVLATVVGRPSQHHLGPREDGLLEVHYRESAWALGNIPQTRTRREQGASHAEARAKRRRLPRTSNSSPLHPFLCRF